MNFRRYKDLRDVPHLRWIALSVGYSGTLLVAIAASEGLGYTSLRPIMVVASYIAFAVPSWVGIRCKRPLLILFGVLNGLPFAYYILVPFAHDIFLLN